MTKTYTSEAVAKIVRSNIKEICPEIGLDDNTDDVALTYQLGFSSVDTGLLIADLELRFDIEIYDDELFETVTDLVTLIQSKL